jgi:hypothetical protein
VYTAGIGGGLLSSPEDACIPTEKTNNEITDAIKKRLGFMVFAFKSMGVYFGLHSKT